MEDPGALEALYTVIQYYNVVNVHSCYRRGDDMKIHFVLLPSRMILQSPLHLFKGTVQRDGSG
jgi:hypothetical protein